MSPFLAWGDFHARSRFARSTIPEEKWGTTRSLVTYKLIIFATHPNLRRHQLMLRFLETIKRKRLLKQPNLVTSYNGAYLFSVICMPMMIERFEFTVLKRNLKEWHERPLTYICKC